MSSRYPGIETTSQMIAQMTLDQISALICSDRRKTREGAVALVVTNSYAIDRLGKLARGEDESSEAEGV